MTNSLAAVARVAERLADIPERRLSDNRILIVDHDPVFSVLALNSLSLLFDDVVSVRDSLEALQAMQEQEYDLVILEMPGRQSESLLLLARLLFKSDVHSGRILGLWNADAPDADLAKKTAKELGVERLLRAPYDLQAVVEEVVSVLQARVLNGARHGANRPTMKKCMDWNQRVRATCHQTGIFQSRLT